MADVKRYRVGVKSGGDGTAYYGAAIEFASGDYVLHSEHEAAIQAAVEDEREACAALVEDLWDNDRIARAIRARGAAHD